MLIHNGDKEREIEGEDVEVNLTDENICEDTAEDIGEDIAEDIGENVGVEFTDNVILFSLTL
jgi:hypothetical protein